MEILTDDYGDQYSFIVSHKLKAKHVGHICATNRFTSIVAALNLDLYYYMKYGTPNRLFYRNRLIYGTTIFLLSLFISYIISGYFNIFMPDDDQYVDLCTDFGIEELVRNNTVVLPDGYIHYYESVHFFKVYNCKTRGRIVESYLVLPICNRTLMQIEETRNIIKNFSNTKEQKSSLFDFYKFKFTGKMELITIKELENTRFWTRIASICIFWALLTPGCLPCLLWPYSIFNTILFVIKAIGSLVIICRIYRNIDCNKIERE